MRDETDRDARSCFGGGWRGPHHLAGRAVAILDGRGGVLAASGAGLARPGPLPAAEAGVREWTIGVGGDAWRVYMRPQSFGATKLVLLVASPLTDMFRDQREEQEAMLIGIPIVLLLAAGGGIYLASVSLRPIAEALRIQRQFTADSSHELRTPVSVMRAAADVMLSRDHRDEAEYLESLAIVGSQARRMSRLVVDMLVLARADAGVYPRPVVYLGESSASAIAFGSACWPPDECHDQSCVIPEVPFRGGRHLRQLMLNVIQNAYAHTRLGDRCPSTSGKTPS